MNWPQKRILFFITISLSIHLILFLNLIIIPQTRQTHQNKIEIELKVQKELISENESEAKEQKIIKKQSTQNNLPSVKVSPSPEQAKTDLLIKGETLGLEITYPRLSRILGETGEVTIEIPSNQTEEPKITTPSPHQRLNQSALKAIKKALEQKKIEPNPNNPQKITITFKLKED